ncbi:MAG: hypothetical protein HC836_36800 [Richelia sp. RM2_1_2]|nr:hypothetical protein [Richelia sp. RM1_1_1]NJO63556.1 hypothetical protein [Richelia sp. RM2_1_2]
MTNVKLVDSLVEIIKSLTPEEKKLLEVKIRTEDDTTVGSSQHLSLSPKKDDLDDLKGLSNKLQRWSERHPRSIPLLSDYAVSRSGIYEED